MKLRLSEKWTWPVKELSLRVTRSSLLLFPNNQPRNCPFNILLERSSTRKLCWYKRNVGILLESLFRLQLDIARKSNWNKGTQSELSVSISTSLSLHMHPTNSSLEWLANEPNEKPSKRFLLISMSLRDVSLAIKDEMFPLNLFSWISKSWRDVKLYRQEGRVPSKEFTLRSNSSSFLSAHKPAIYIYILIFLDFQK